MKRTLVLVLAVAAAALTGCSRSGTSTFHGKVEYAGRPVTSGVIYFLGPAPEMRMGMGTIYDDGTYSATDVPVGDVRVSFQAPGVPRQYGDPNTSALVFKITPEMKSLDISIPGP
jgi:hypothetical protein